MTDLFFAFLLQSNYTSAGAIVWDVFRVLVPLGLSIYALVSNRSREDTKTKAAREEAEKEWKKKVDVALEKCQERMTGFQTQHERFAEGCARDQEAMKADVQEAKRALQEVALLRQEVGHTNKALDEVKMELRELNNSFREFFRLRTS